jgi:hypothetical protein
MIAGRSAGPIGMRCLVFPCVGIPAPSDRQRLYMIVFPGAGLREIPFSIALLDFVGSARASLCSSDRQICMAACMCARSSSRRACGAHLDRFNNRGSCPQQLASRAGAALAAERSLGSTSQVSASGLGVRWWHLRMIGCSLKISFTKTSGSHLATSAGRSGNESRCDRSDAAASHCLACH